MNHEQYLALREAVENRASEDYFCARPKAASTAFAQISFAHGFQRGYDALDGELQCKDKALLVALEALEYHQEQTRPIQRTTDAIDKVREVLG